MGLTIDDGKGSGSSAEVTTDNLLKTFAVTETEFEFSSDVKGKAFAWASGTYDPAAGDTILLVKNTSTSEELHIDAIWLSTDVDTRVVIHMPTTNVTVAGTTITGTNLNSQSGNAAAASAARDETGNTQGDIIWSGEIMAAEGMTDVSLGGALILGQNASVGVDFVANVAACDVTIWGHYL